MPGQFSIFSLGGLGGMSALNGGVDLVVMGLIYSLFNIILQWLKDIMDTVYHVFRALLYFRPHELLFMLSEDINYFYTDIFIRLAMIALFLIMLMYLWLNQFKPDAVEAESPGRLIIRAVILMFVVYYSVPIINFVYSIFEIALDQMLSVLSMTTTSAPFTTLANFVEETLTNILPKAANLGDTDGNVLASALTVLILLYYIRVFIRMVSALVVRHVVNIVLMVIGPVAWITGVSKNTDHIMTSYIKMFLSNLLSILIGLFGVWLYMCILNLANADGVNALMVHNDSIRHRIELGGDWINNVGGDNALRTVGLFFNAFLIGAIGEIFPRIEQYLASMGFVSVVPSAINNHMKSDGAVLSTGLGVVNATASRVSGDAGRLAGGLLYGKGMANAAGGVGSRGAATMGAAGTSSAGATATMGTVGTSSAGAAAIDTAGTAGGAAVNGAGTVGGAAMTAVGGAGLLGLGAVMYSSWSTMNTESKAAGMTTARYKSIKEDAGRLNDGGVYTGKAADNSFKNLVDTSGGVLENTGSLAHDDKTIEGLQKWNQSMPNSGIAGTDDIGMMEASGMNGLAYDSTYHADPQALSKEQFTPDGSMPYQVLSMGNGHVEGLYQDGSGATGGFTGDLITKQEFENNPVGAIQLSNGDYMRFTNAQAGSPLASMSQQNHYDSSGGRFAPGSSRDAHISEDGTFQ